MKKAVLVQAVGLLSTVFLWNFNITKASAASLSTNDSLYRETNVNDNSIGGMSRLLNDYYDNILSEKGISINNVDTTIYVDGEKLIAKDPSSILFHGLGLANVMDYVNIRSNPSISSEIVGRLYRAGAVHIKDVYGDWAKVTSGQVTGYIKTEFLYTGEDAIQFAKNEYTQYAKATCQTLNVRSGPGENYGIITQISIGDKLPIKQVMEEWVEVALPNSNKKAYVSKNYVDYVYDFKYAKNINELKTDINCMVWPLPSDHTIYTYYGYRIAPIKGASTFHQGLDIGGPYGATVVSVLDGTVVRTGYSSSAGRFVEIDHGNGVMTRYLHNSRLLVKEGEHVDQGQPISLVGSTGISTGPHLHFSLIKDGKNIDPYPYLKYVH